MTSLHEEAQNSVIKIMSNTCDTISVKVESTRRKCSLLTQGRILPFKLIYSLYVNLWTSFKETTKFNRGLYGIRTSIVW